MMGWEVGGVEVMVVVFEAVAVGGDGGRWGCGW